MLQSHVTALPLTLVIAIHVACLISLVAVLLAAREFPGWRMVGPGGMHWFSFLGSWGFAALITWVWLFVGSARRDAETQMRYALLLVLAFGICAAWSGFYIARLRRTALRWRGTAIRWRARGKDIVQDMADFEAHRRGWSEQYQLRFRDGTILKLDLHAHNAQELAVAIAERAGIEID